MENLIYTLSYTLGWSILHSLWQAAILYIILCMCNLFIPAINAKTKYNLAIGTQMLIFVNFIGTLIYYYQHSLPTLNLAALDQESLIQLFTESQRSSFSLENIFPYLAAGYAIGFGIQILLLTNNLINLRNLKYKGLASVPKNWNLLFENAKEKLKISHGVNLYLSNNISVPLTLGYLKPFVLFPVAYVNRMNTEQVEAILLHELAHVKRQDYLYNLIKVAVETLLFFNPFIWAISKIIEKEREHACDDMVVEQLETPLTYANALVELEELRMSLTPALTLAATGQKNQLFNRIKRITNIETRYKNVKQQLFAVLLSGLSVMILALLTQIQSSQAVENQSPQTSSGIYTRQALADTVHFENKHVYINKIQMPEPEKSELPVQAIPAAPAMDADKRQPDTVKLPKKVEINLEELKKGTEKIQVYFNSPEWKEHISAVENLAKEVQKEFDSPEWKKHIKKIEESGAEIEKYFESPEWKNQLEKIEKASAKIELESAKIDQYFNSPEWKNEIKKIEMSAEKTQKYFESDEWKKKIKEIEALNNSAEMKEIQNRYQKEINALKQKKGVSNL